MSACIDAASSLTRTLSATSVTWEAVTLAQVLAGGIVLQSNRFRL